MKFHMEIGGFPTPYCQFIASQIIRCFCNILFIWESETFELSHMNAVYLAICLSGTTGRMERFAKYQVYSPTTAHGMFLTVDIAVCCTPYSGVHNDFSGFIVSRRSGAIKEQDFLCFNIFRFGEAAQALHNRALLHAVFISRWV